MLDIGTYWRDLGEIVTGAVAPDGYSNVAHLPTQLLRSMQDMEQAIADLQSQVRELTRGDTNK